jgi:hypothetical protein
MESADKRVTQPLSLDETNRILRVYGESVRHFFREQQRSAMVSPLFNLPGRLVLGSYCYYHQLPALLDSLVRRAAPEEIGRRMKRLCSRANAVHLNSLLLGYLNGREQLRLRGLLDTQHSPGDAAPLARVVDFCVRASAAYRNDGLLVPDQADFSMPILPSDAVEHLAAQLEPGRRATSSTGRRMLATLELFAFIQNGEARIGSFHHGPYPLPGGDAILVKEYVGLQDDYYPWARTAARLPCAAVARVMRLRGVRSKIVLFGSLTTDPPRFEDSVVSDVILLRVAREMRPPLPEEIEAISRAAADAQAELYRRFLDWDDRQRIRYGAQLYGCILRTLAEPIGFADEFGREIRARFEETAAHYTDGLLSGADPPVVLSHIATTDGPIYAPVETQATQAGPKR